MKVTDKQTEWDEAGKYAYLHCRENLEWYVLVYNAKTTEYLNQIVFTNYIEAMIKYGLTNPQTSDEAVEIIYSPQNEEFVNRFGEDNIVMHRKTLA